MSIQIHLLVIFISLFFYKSSDNISDKKCYNIWSESFLPLISCKEYSIHTIKNYSSIKLYYDCCETFSSINCIHKSTNFTLNIKPDNYHSHIHPINNYVFLYNYSFVDYFYYNIYLYKTTCYCTQYLIDYPCEFGSSFQDNNIYYPVNSRCNGYIMLDTKQKFYVMLNYLIKNNYYVGIYSKLIF